MASHMGADDHAAPCMPPEFTRPFERTLASARAFVACVEAETELVRTHALVAPLPFAREEHEGSVRALEAALKRAELAFDAGADVHLVRLGKCALLAESAEAAPLRRSQVDLDTVVNDARTLQHA